jgi:hypothetical protein
VNRELIARLHDANPVPELPAVEPVERLRRTLEQEPPLAARSPRERPGRSIVRLAVSAAALALVAVGAGVMIVSGSSGPGVNVAAAAFAAVSPPNGIIEAEFVQRVPHGKLSFLLPQREWIEPSTGRRRERNVTPARVHGKHLVMEQATSPGWIELWDSAESEADTIFRIRDAPGARSAPGGPQQPAEIRAPGSAEAGLALYRRLFQERSIRLVGRERHDGRELWKLESYVAFAQANRKARLTPLIAIVVLVDPRTFLPVVERQLNLMRPGHPVMVETVLVRSRHLSASPAREAQLTLTAVHPRAHVVEHASHH